MFVYKIYQHKIKYLSQNKYIILFNRNLIHSNQCKQLQFSLSLEKLSLEQVLMVLRNRFQICKENAWNLQNQFWFGFDKLNMP